MEAYKYENLQIGSFLISVGYYLRDIGEKCQISMNLYQQTWKHDYTIGDLFGALEGKCFIIEFKSNKKLINNELKKKQRKMLIERLRGSASNLVEISLKGHLICYMDEINDHWDYHLKPYYQVLAENVKIERYHITGVRDFVNELLKVPGNIGCDIKQIKEYIALLKLCANGENYSASGIIATYSRKNGFTYAPFEDLNMLERKIKVEKDLSFNIDLDIDRNRGRGLDMDMW